jgi:hypothetical protein
MANACVFCGDSAHGLTNEHVYGDWVSNLYGPDDSGIHQLVDRTGVVRSWDEIPFQRTVRVVCGACNSGWMSRIENSASPHVGPMIQGRRRLLRSQHQLPVAQWAWKVALMSDHLHPDNRLIPESEYRSFYETKRPGELVNIWLGRIPSHVDSHGELVGGCLKQQASVTLTDDSGTVMNAVNSGQRAYGCTIVAGDLLVQVFGHNFSSYVVEVEVPGDLLYRVWPRSGRFTWPPDVSFPPSMDEAHQVLMGATGGAR